MQSPGLGRRLFTHKWLLLAGVLIVIIIFGGLWISFHFSPILQRRAAEALSDRFDSEVEIRDFHASRNFPLLSPTPRRKANQPRVEGDSRTSPG